MIVEVNPVIKGTFLNINSIEWHDVVDMKNKEQKTLRPAR